ncbi:hypothetical protein RUM43_002647 [Polyplax serrata]|uniref:Uncharacterized protein n=1 Tax=Polyplax serrata TaxID=468196 RepID=A0AAN8NZF4_POLSC
MIPDLNGFHVPVFMAGCPVSQKSKQQRPWPPVYRQHVPNRAGLYFRHQEYPPWMDYSRYNGDYRDKGREYYYLAPLYRNALPPPLQPTKLTPPRRVMLLNPNAKNCYSECPCIQRTRSLEDVRSDVNSEWSDDDLSVFRYDRRNFESPDDFGHNRKSIFDVTPPMESKRMGRPKVRLPQWSSFMVRSI